MSLSKDTYWSKRAQDPTLLAKSDEWRTPARIFQYANARYGPFLLDAAAARWNHQCAKYCSKLQTVTFRPVLFTRVAGEVAQDAQPLLDDELLGPERERWCQVCRELPDNCSCLPNEDLEP